MPLEQGKNYFVAVWEGAVTEEAFAKSKRKKQRISKSRAVQAVFNGTADTASSSFLCFCNHICSILPQHSQHLEPVLKSKDSPSNL